MPKKKTSDKVYIPQGKGGYIATGSEIVELIRVAVWQSPPICAALGCSDDKKNLVKFKRLSKGIVSTLFKQLQSHSTKRRNQRLSPNSEQGDAPSALRQKGFFQALENVLGIAVPWTERDNVFKLIDKNESSAIEFSDFYTTFGVSSGMSEPSKKKLTEKLGIICQLLFERHFTLRDIFGDSDYLSLAEFVKAFQRLDIGMTHAEIYALMRSIDQDLDRRIQYTEFRDYFRTLYQQYTQHQKRKQSRTSKQSIKYLPGPFTPLLQNSLSISPTRSGGLEVTAHSKLDNPLLLNHNMKSLSPISSQGTGDKQNDECNGRDKHPSVARLWRGPVFGVIDRKADEVVFVVDLSSSMQTCMRVAKIDTDRASFVLAELQAVLARQLLPRCLAGIDILVNIVAFNESKVTMWKRKPQKLNVESLQEIDKFCDGILQLYTPKSAYSKTQEETQVNQIERQQLRGSFKRMSGTKSEHLKPVVTAALLAAQKFASSQSRTMTYLVIATAPTSTPPPLKSPSHTLTSFTNTKTICLDQLFNLDQLKAELRASLRTLQPVCVCAIGPLPFASCVNNSMQTLAVQSKGKYRWTDDSGASVVLEPEWSSYQAEWLKYLEKQISVSDAKSSSCSETNVVRHWKAFIRGNNSKKSSTSKLNSRLQSRQPLHSSPLIRQSDIAWQHSTFSLLCSAFLSVGADWDTLFRAFDLNGDGTVSLYEFIRVVKHLLKGTTTMGKSSSGLSTVQQQLLWKCISPLGKKNLTIDEFKLAFSRIFTILGISPTPSQCPTVPNTGEADELDAISEDSMDDWLPDDLSSVTSCGNGSEQIDVDTVIKVNEFEIGDSNTPQVIEANVTTQDGCMNHDTTQDGCMNHDTTQDGCMNHDTTQDGCMNHDTTQDDSKEQDTTQDVSKEHDLTQDDSKEHDTTQDVSKQHGTTQDVSKEHDITQGVSKEHDTTQDDSKEHDITQGVSKEHDITQDDSKEQDTTLDVSKEHDITQDVSKKHDTTADTSTSSLQDFCCTQMDRTGTTSSSNSEDLNNATCKQNCQTQQTKSNKCNHETLKESSITREVIATFEPIQNLDDQQRVSNHTEGPGMLDDDDILSTSFFTTLSSPRQLDDDALDLQNEEYTYNVCNATIGDTENMNRRPPLLPLVPSLSHKEDLTLSAVSRYQTIVLELQNANKHDSHFHRFCLESSSLGYDAHPLSTNCDYSSHQLSTYQRRTHDLRFPLEESVETGVLDSLSLSTILAIRSTLLFLTQAEGSSKQSSKQDSILRNMLSNPETSEEIHNSIAMLNNVTLSNKLQHRSHATFHSQQMKTWLHDNDLIELDLPDIWKISANESKIGKLTTSCTGNLHASHDSDSLPSSCLLAITRIREWVGRIVKCGRLGSKLFVFDTSGGFALSSNKSLSFESGIRPEDQHSGIFIRVAKLVDIEDEIYNSACWMQLLPKHFEEDGDHEMHIQLRDGEMVSVGGSIHAGTTCFVPVREFYTGELSTMCAGLVQFCGHFASSALTAISASSVTTSSDAGPIPAVRLEWNENLCHSEETRANDAVLLQEQQPKLTEMSHVSVRSNFMNDEELQFAVLRFDGTGQTTEKHHESLPQVWVAGLNPAQASSIRNHGIRRAGQQLVGESVSCVSIKPASVTMPKVSWASTFKEVAGVPQVKQRFVLELNENGMSYRSYSSGTWNNYSLECNSSTSSSFRSGADSVAQGGCYSDAGLRNGLCPNIQSPQVDSYSQSPQWDAHTTNQNAQRDRCQGGDIMTEGLPSPLAISTTHKASNDAEPNENMSKHFNLVNSEFLVMFIVQQQAVLDALLLPKATWKTTNEDHDCDTIFPKQIPDTATLNECLATLRLVVVRLCTSKQESNRVGIFKRVANLFDKFAKQSTQKYIAIPQSTKGGGVLLRYSKPTRDGPQSNSAVLSLSKSTFEIFTREYLGIGFGWCHASGVFNALAGGFNSIVTRDSFCEALFGHTITSPPSVSLKHDILCQLRRALVGVAIGILQHKSHISQLFSKRTMTVSAFLRWLSNNFGVRLDRTVQTALIVLVDPMFTRCIQTTSLFQVFTDVFAWMFSRLIQLDAGTDAIFRGIRESMRWFVCNQSEEASIARSREWHNAEMIWMLQEAEREIRVQESNLSHLLARSTSEPKQCVHSNKTELVRDLRTCERRRGQLMAQISRVKQESSMLEALRLAKKTSHQCTSTATSSVDTSIRWQHVALPDRLTNQNQSTFHTMVCECETGACSNNLLFDFVNGSRDAVNKNG